MASGGDLRIAIGVQDLTRSGIARIVNQLRQIPGGLEIAIKAVADLKAIQNARNNMVEAAKTAQELNGKLSGSKSLGKNWLSGAIADAKRFETNIHNLDKSLSKLGTAGNKVSINGILSNFGRLDQRGQGDWLERIAERSRRMVSELGRLEAKGKTINPNDTQAVKAHEREVANLTNRLQQYMALQQKMQSINTRQARTIATNQQRLNASDLLVQRTTHGSTTQGLLVGYDAKSLKERQAIMAGLEKQQRNLQQQLNTKNATRSTIDKSDTQAVRAHEAAVKALVDQLRQLGQARKSAERMDKQIARADARLFAQMQQSDRSVASAVARNQGAFDRASFSEYMRHFKTFSQEGQRSALRGVINDRINVRGSLDAETRKLQGINPADTQAIAAQEQRVAQLRAQYSALTNQILQMRNAMDATNKNTARGIEQLSRSFERINASMGKNRLNNLLNQFKGLDATNQLRVFDRITQKVNEVQQKLANLSAKGKTINPNDTQAVKAHEREVARLTQQLNALTNAQSRMRNTMTAQQGKAAAQAMRDARQAAAQYRAELNGVQVAMRSTSQFAQQLRDDIQQAFSYYALKQFLSNLIEIGGQFEYQRMAIANILRDTTKANTLFVEIKDLAMRSPFSTLELDKYAKQLAAFNIPYNQMFEKLSKIADIAAGTGADMSRIILAYGHVKSEGYLTGIQRRQFSNANINIVGGLADYYSKQEGYRVTTKDVYNRIHDKQVTFEDMDTVLMSMAEEGGQFYQMQEAMASTVKGVYKNLSDAVNHVYMSIEKSNNGILMGIGKGLTWLLKLIEKFPGVATNFVAAMVAMASIRAMAAAGINKEAAATVRRIALLDKEMVANKRLRVVEGQRAATLATNVMLGKTRLLQGQALSAASAQQIANTIKLGGAEGVAMRQAVLHGVARRKLNAELAIYLVRVGAITAAEARGAIASRTFFGAIAMGAKAAWVSIKGLMSSLWPMLAMFAAFEGISWIVGLFSDSEEIEQQRQQIDRLRDSYNSLKRSIDELSDQKISDMDSTTLFETTKDMVEAIKDNLATAENVLGRIFEQDSQGNYLHNSVQQAEMLREHLEASAEAQKMLLSKDGYFDTSDLKGEFDDMHDESLALKGLQSELIRDPEFITKFEEYLDDFINYSKGRGYQLGVDAGNSLKEITKGLDKGTPLKYLNEFIEKADDTSIDEFDDYLNSIRQKGTIAERTDKSNISRFLTQIGDYKEEQSEAEGAFLEKVENWYLVLEGLGIDDPEQQIHDIDAVIKSIPELGQEGVAYYGDLFLRTYYPEIWRDRKDYTHKSKPTNSVQAVRDAVKKAGGKGFQIPNEAKPTEILEKLAEFYKSSNEKIDAYIKNNNEYLKKKGITDTNKVRIEIDGVKRDSIEFNIFEEYNQLIRNRDAAIAGAKAIYFNEDALKELNKTKDTELDALKLEYTTLNNAYQRYKEGLDGGLGSEGAIKTIEGDYEPVIKKLNQNRSLSGFVELIDQFVTDNEAFLKNSNKNERQAFYNKILNDKKQREIDVLKRNAKDASDLAKKQYSNSLSNYELYMKMYNATGSHKQAGEFVYGEENVAAKLGYEHYVKDAFNELMRDFKIDTNYDSALNYNKTEWEAIPNWVKPIFKEAKDAIEKWTKKMQESYIDLIEANKSYDAQVKKINKEHDDAVKIIDISGKSDQDKVDLRLRADAKRDLALEELRLKRIAFGNRVSMMSEEEVTKTINDYVNLLKKALETGAISDSEYSSKMNDVQGWKDKRREETMYGDRITTAFLKGGVPSIMKTVEDEYKKMMNTPIDDKTGLPDGYTREEKEELEAKYKEYFGEDGKGGIKAIQDFIEALEFGAKSIKASLDLFANMFDALGNESVAKGLGTVSSVLGGAMNGASALEFLGPYGQIAGGVIGSITSIAQLHDKKINRAIESSKRLQKEYERLQKISDRAQERSISKAAFNDQYSYDMLVKQRGELNKQLGLELSKKKKDKDAIAAIQGNLDELNDKIQYYWSDLLSERYGLDFKNYAKRLGDALTEAFKRGENAAIAWKKTVGDIVRELANQMILNKFIAPLFQDVYDKAFEVGGRFYGKSEITEDDIKWLADELMGIGENDGLKNAEAIYKALEKAFPYSSDSESVGGLTRLGEQLTEETGSVIASYLNSIRADVGANRKHLNEVVERGLPALESINVIAQSQLSCLNSIAQSTAVSAQSAQNIENILSDVVNGYKEFYMH